MQKQYQPVHQGRFQALWTASIASYFAYWLIRLALPLFAQSLTKSPLLVSGVTFSLTAPTFVFGLFAGVFVDRYERKHMLLLMTGIRLLAFALALFVALLHDVTLTLLYTIALLLGTTQTVEEPALAAIVPMIVPQEHLEQANSWLTGSQNFISLFALPLGGLLASVGAALTMSVGEGCALLALFALFLLRGSFLSEYRVKHHIIHELFDGIYFLWKRRVLWSIGIMAGVINACWSGYLAIFVLFAVKPGPMHLSVFTCSLLLMTDGIGSVIGALIALPVQRLCGKRWAIGINVVGNGIMCIAPALTTNVWFIGASIALGGIVGPLWTIGVASLLGRAVPAELQGRVNAVYRFLGEGLAVIGPLLVGLIAQTFGLRVAFALCAIGTFSMCIPFLLVITEKAME